MCFKQIAMTILASSLCIRGFCGSDREKRISDLEKQMMEIGAFNRNQTFGAVFGPSKPSSSQGAVFFDALIYKASVGEQRLFAQV